MKGLVNRTGTKYVFFLRWSLLLANFVCHLWTVEEILKCRKESFRSLLVHDVLILFDKVGGVPRSVLFLPSKQPQKAITEGLSGIKSALQRITNPVEVNDCLMAGNDTADFSSQPIHLVPDPNDYLLILWAVANGIFVWGVVEVLVCDRGNMA